MDLIRRCNWEKLDGWERAGRKKVEPDEAVAKQLRAIGYFDGK
jgi:hypothetical protein